MILLQGAGSGVDVPLACGIVGVKAVLAGTAAGEVLGGHGNAVGGDAVIAALDPGNDVLGDLADQCGIFAEGAVAALPAGVGHAVHHVHIALAQVAGFPALTGSLCPLVGNFDAAALDGGCDAQGAGPGGEHAAGIVHAEDDLAVLVTGVGSGLDRHEALALFGNGLQLVQIVSQIIGLSVFTEDGMTGEPLLDQGGGAGQMLLTKDGLLV